MSQCRWRARHTAYIREHYVSEGICYEDLIEHTRGLMTYCEVVELHGKVMPTSQRGRNLIDVVAAGSAVQPLRTTLILGEEWNQY